MLQIGCLVCSEFTVPHLHPVPVTLTLWLCITALLHSTEIYTTSSNSTSEDSLSFDILLLSLKTLIMDLSKIMPFFSLKYAPSVETPI